MNTTQTTCDVAVIGGGIVGLATAWALVQQGSTSIVVLEAEDEVGSHQTGHNSGVIHSGLYYRPGSLKALTCAEGRQELIRFCATEGIPYQQCGKLVVATSDAELPALHELQRRGQANGLQGLRWLTARQIADYEPHARGVAALWVPQTGIVDFRQVAVRIAAHLNAAGAEVRTGHRLIGCARDSQALVLQTTAGTLRARRLVNCAGLQSDRVARLCGVKPAVAIVPFRGEYYTVVEGRRHLVRNLLYPVPDPRFPFLGVHFTRTIYGQLEAGPNAVLAFSRHGYRRRDVSLRDSLQVLAYPGFWRVASRYWRTGLAEILRSLSKRSFVAALQRLVPDLRPEDIQPGGAGVRAQALAPDGTLVDDFHVVRTPRMVHVLNAPSPAATAAFAIGRRIADMLAEGNFQPHTG